MFTHENINDNKKKKIEEFSQYFVNYNLYITIIIIIV